MEKTVLSSMSGNRENRGAESGALIERPGAPPLEYAALGFVSGAAGSGSPIGAVLHDGPDFTLSARILPPRRSRIPRIFRRPEYLAGYVSRDGDLHLESAFGLLGAFIAESGGSAGPAKSGQPAGGLKARGFWFLLSDRGGIYLHETVTAEEIWKRFARAPRLCVLNPENGTVCLSPGHRMNREFTARFHDLLENFRSTPKAAWEREAEKALGLCLEAMVNGK